MRARDDVFIVAVTSPPDELRLLLRQERGVADAEILGVEAVEALVELGVGQRTRIGEPPRELLVPARRRAARPRRCAPPWRALRSPPRRRRTTRVTSPFSFASRASKMRPSSRISSATAAPTSRTSGAISGYAITSPRFLIGAPKRLDSPQMRRSHSAAISRPPPTQMPWICATSGWRQRGERRAPSRASRRRTRSPAPCSRARSRTRRCRCRARTPARLRRAG